MPQSDSMRAALAEVLRIALPLMVSTGMFSLVLFIDRTLLLWHEPTQMGAAMAAGNLFWVTICVFVGIVSMTGAIASQYVGAGQRSRIGRLLWQSIWFSLATIPLFAGLGYFAEALFEATGQAPSLVPMEAIYYRILLWGGAGEVMQTALSGFFSGTHRTRTIAIVSIFSGLVNLVLDLVLIFGIDPAWLGMAAVDGGERWLEMGIAGAAIASVISFWFKAFCYGGLLLLPNFRKTYGMVSGMCWDARMMKRLVYYGFPTGLMYATEAGAFSVIVLMIGRLGDVPLQATTMAINFNMVAFIPLVGMSIAASVLVGQHLVRSGPEFAGRRVWAALIISWIYASAWALTYWLGADILISLYELNPTAAETVGDASIAADATRSLQIAEGLLGFVAIYVVLDATQLILAGALRGAGDSWFVLVTGLTVSVTFLVIGVTFEPEWTRNTPSAFQALQWWWWILTGWVIALGLAMTARYAQGSWKQMRMV
ncbi:multidrug resistance protein, MATE family [Neorhodopirellula lusitana]|uniref:Multidrug resistance protein, MATE family n=1 Tax=Neorhodopirellula lusitana TaxID=445327 RepID=A0ABY1QNE2_9BACT|nr:MATE family efflux transporter [Neorhodopirellula lusitana]SMP73206.1 multidrug resistance protein, MATE family [Neorhodopirellula lusitana]